MMKRLLLCIAITGQCTMFCGTEQSGGPSSRSQQIQNYKILTELYIGAVFVLHGLTVASPNVPKEYLTDSDKKTVSPLVTLPVGLAFLGRAACDILAYCS